MQKYPIGLFLRASVFMIISCSHQDQRKIASNLDNGLVTHTDEVYIFYKSGHRVVIKQCEDNTVLKHRTECVLKDGTKEKQIDEVEFKKHFKNAFGVPANYATEMANKIKISKEEKVGNVESFEKQKIALQASIKKLTNFIDAEAAASTDTKKLQVFKVTLNAIDARLGDNAQLSAAISKINQLTDELVDTIIDRRSIPNFSISQSSANFDYNILQHYIKTPNISMEFATIPAGHFRMGSPFTEVGRSDVEIPHQVTLTNSFDLQTTEVTQAQWFEVMGYNNSYFSKSKYCDDFQEINNVGLCPSNPVENVSWNEVQEFINKLNAPQETFTYRLPTEAEWEYAARGGSNAAYSFGDNDSKLRRYAWYDSNSRVKWNYQTHKVAQKDKNQFNLYDMYGNVWEFVEDLYDHYPNFDVINPLNSATGRARVIRGGSFGNNPESLRSAYRDSRYPDSRQDNVGFRLLRTPR